MTSLSEQADSWALIPKSEDPLEAELLLEASEMILAICASIPHGHLDPKVYWDRLQRSLKQAADSSMTFPEMVSRFHERLNLSGAFRMATAKRLYLIYLGLERRQQFDQFRSICSEQAAWIIVDARVRREEMKLRHDPKLLALEADDEETITPELAPLMGATSQQATR